MTSSEGRQAWGEGRQAQRVERHAKRGRNNTLRAAAVLVQGCPGLQGPGRRCVGDHQAQVPYKKTLGSETGSVNRRARPLAVFSGGRIWGPHGEPLCPRRQRSSASPLNAMRPRTGGRIELCRYGPSIVKSTMLRRALRLSPERLFLLCGSILFSKLFFGRLPWA